MTLQITMTPTLQRFNQLLDDGESHLKEEFVALLWDEESDPDTTIRQHLSTLRKVLAILGEEIVCETAGFGRRVTYRKRKALS